MSLAILGFRTATAAQEREEAARSQLMRDRAKALRRHKRREVRLRVFRWCRRNKMAVYPVGAMSSFAAGFFSWGVLPGFISLGLGFLVLEWRFSR